MNKDKFKLIVRRKLPMLFESFSVLGRSEPKYFQELLGKNLIMKSRLYLDEKVYWRENELSELGHKLIRQVKRNPRFLRKITQVCYQEGDELVRYSEKIKKQNLTKLKNSILINLFLGFAERTMQMIKFLDIPLALENYLSKSLLDILAEKVSRGNLVDKYFKILILPIRQNDIVLEKKELLKIVLATQKNKKWYSLFQRPFKEFKRRLKNQPPLEKRLKKHLDNFAWLTCPYYIGQPTTLAGLYSKIKILLKTKVKKELNTLVKNPLVIKNRTNSLMKSCRFTPPRKKTSWGG